MCERKSLRPQGLARMTAEGARGCAWRAAGRRCRGCRHADVSRHRTQPYRTVPYRTILCLTLQQEHTAKHILPCLSQRKPGGKKAAVGNRRKCGKRVENLFQGAQAAAGGRGRGGQPDGYFRPGVVRRGAAVDRSGARGRGCGGADAGSGGGRVRRSMGQCRQGGDVRVRQGLLVGPSLERAFGRCGCGGRFWLARCGGRAVRDAGAAQGALAGFLDERKNA